MKLKILAFDFTMRKISVIIFYCMLSHSVLGWGPTGHRVTGWIAEKYLNKKAKKELYHLLKGQSLAMASTWMDEIRSDTAYHYTADWHWVTIPDSQHYEQCVKNPAGDIIETLERIVIALKTKKLRAEVEAEHIKMLIHLIGDIHQPLHVGNGKDKGGNAIDVTWFRKPSNLHRVWDSDMIDDTQLSYTELAESLDQPSIPELTAWQHSPVRAWAHENLPYRKQVYDYGKGTLGYAYTYRYFYIVRHRLLQAGVRLAGVLNTIYGS